MSRASIAHGETKGVEIATRHSINNYSNVLKTFDTEGRNTERSWNLQHLRVSTTTIYIL